MWRRPLLIACLTTICALPAFASGRPFPAGAKRGTMSPGAYPEIMLDGQARRLATGARIWNQKNLIEMPAYIQGSDLTVNYTENAQGNIDRVWILTPEEASRPGTAAQ